MTGKQNLMAANGRKNHPEGNTVTGFTLIELMIVVAIIGILAAIAIPMYRNYVAKAQLTEAFSVVSDVKNVITENFNQAGSCPDNAGGNPGRLVEPKRYAGKYIAELTAGGEAQPEGGCVITVKFNDNGLSMIAGRTLVMTMRAHGGEAEGEGSLEWICESPDGIPEGILPKVCANVDSTE